MIRRTKTDKKQEQMIQCKDCAFAKWDMKPINLTVDGQKPFMLRCPFERYLRFPTDRACNRFRLKN